MFNPGMMNAGMFAPPAGQKTGAFTEWAEDSESVELKLPLPPGTTKHELKAIFTPTSMSVTLRDSGKELLVVNPLAARMVSDEVTWYLEDSIMVITLAKMQGVGKSEVDQTWGESLAAPSGKFTCYMRPEDVTTRLRPSEARAELARKSGLASAMLTTGVAIAVVVIACIVLAISHISDRD